jgi:hypothetical protein
MEDMDVAFDEFEEYLKDVYGLANDCNEISMFYDRIQNIVFEDDRGYNVRATAYNFEYVIGYTIPNHIYEKYLHKQWRDITKEDLDNIYKQDFVDWLYDYYEDLAVEAIEDDPSCCRDLEIDGE